MERIGGDLGSSSGDGELTSSDAGHPTEETSPVRKSSLEEAAIRGLVTCGSYVCSLKWLPQVASLPVSAL